MPKLVRSCGVAKLFSSYCVFDYIYTFYDVLHTTEYNYIHNEIDIFLKYAVLFCCPNTKWIIPIRIKVPKTGNRFSGLFGVKIWRHIESIV